MRTLAGDAPYTIENQSVVEIMYRTWLFIFSFTVLLPLRWLPNVLPNPSKAVLPIAATAALITCGELVLGNPTVTPAGPYCPGDMIQITFTGTNLPDGELIEVFIGDNTTYNPFMGGGTLIGTIPVDYNCTTCPSLLGIMAQPCGSDTDNEYAVISSGCGFNVNDLLFNLDVNNNTGVGNADPGSAACPFGTPDPALIAALQAGNCATLIFPVGPGDVVPAGVNVILFTDSGVPLPFKHSQPWINYVPPVSQCIFFRIVVCALLLLFPIMPQWPIRSGIIP